MKRSAVRSLVVDSGRESLVSSAGGLLLQRTLHCSGLEKAMSAALGPWRAPRAVHDPAKVVLDLAIAVALGGDCAADLAVVRAQPQLFGAVASDATVSRLVATRGCQMVCVGLEGRISGHGDRQGRGFGTG